MVYLRHGLAQRVALSQGMVYFRPGPTGEGESFR